MVRRVLSFILTGAFLNSTKSFRLILALSVLLLVSAAAQQVAPAQQSAEPLVNFLEVMIPMRDGVHLQTVILTPVDQKGPLPILFLRTPYGVPDKPTEQMSVFIRGYIFRELEQDGYIFVIQNLRGRFKSEGAFSLSSWVDLNDPKAANETTDAYDSIEWLVKNVPGNNGKVGMKGVSYDGLTAALALLHPHPALKAISEQASPVDQWMNDDHHRYGALRESYTFEYTIMYRPTRTRTRISISRLTTPISGISVWVRSRTPTRNISTAPFLSGTRS